MTESSQFFSSTWKKLPRLEWVTGLLWVYFFFICSFPRKWLLLRIDKHRHSNSLHYAAIWNGTRTISSVAGFVIKNAFPPTYLIHSDLLFSSLQAADLKWDGYSVWNSQLIQQSLYQKFTVECMYNALWKIIFLTSTFILFSSKNVKREMHPIKQNYIY